MFHFWWWKRREIMARGQMAFREAPSNLGQPKFFEALKASKNWECHGTHTIYIYMCVCVWYIWYIWYIIYIYTYGIHLYIYICGTCGIYTHTHYTYGIIIYKTYIHPPSSGRTSPKTGESFWGSIWANYDNSLTWILRPFTFDKRAPPAWAQGVTRGLFAFLPILGSKCSLWNFSFLR